MTRGNKPPPVQPGHSLERGARLLTTAVFGFYIAYLLISYSNRGLFEYIGIDFRALYASAIILRDHGFAAVYDLAVQAQYQAPLYDKYSFGPGRLPFAIVPIPYLPLFVVLAVPFSYLDPVTAYALWTLANLAVLVGYTAWWVRDIRRLATFASGPWSPLMFSLPAFLTLLFGQVNVLLYVAVGEWLRNLRRERPFVSGLWLSILSLKPQLLVLLVPALLFARLTAPLAGLLAGTALILLGSIGLAGPEGMLRLMHLVLEFAQRIPKIFPESMMNWHAIGILASLWLPAPTGLIVTIAGSLASVVLAAWAFLRQREDLASRQDSLAAIALSAGMVTAWHSHVHMALAMGLPLYLLSNRARAWQGFFLLWTLGPALLFVLSAMTLGPGPAHLGAGYSYLGLHLATLSALARRTGKDGPSEPSRPGSGPALAKQEQP